MKYVFLLAILCPSLTMCQPLSLRGKIINESGEPIFGATIAVLRSTANNGQQPTANNQLTATGPQTTTNAAGEFTISNLQLEDTLLVTATGYTPATEVFDETLSRHPVITIALKLKAATVDEIMIIAYHGFAIINNKNR